MAKRDLIEEKTIELIEPITKEHGFELVDVDYMKEGSDYYLRVYIDKPGGITINDCELISREFNPILDDINYIADAYIFEVSSPGLTRPLRKEKDFERSLGKLIDIKLYKKIEGYNEYNGILKNYDANTVTISFEDGMDITLNKSNISLIRLAYVEEK